MVETAGKDDVRPILWIQALRALAAITVAAVHMIGGFAWFIDERLHNLPNGEQLSQAAVALFFIISGCVMVISSREMFGQPAGPARFWRRRVVRVIPPYWIASLLLAAVFALLSLPIEPSEVARSLAFAFWSAEGGVAGEFALFLWPGWTLFYELVFYGLFGLFIGLGRARAILACSIALFALVGVGVSIAPDALLAFALTRPILLLFVAGMVIALVLHRLARAPAWMAFALVAAAVLCFVMAPTPRAHLGFGTLIWAGAPALLLFLAAAGLRLRGAAASAARILGDASYAVYLLHVPFAHAWMKVFNIWLGHPGGSVAYLALGLPLLVVLSIGFYRFVERPMTDRLNRLLGGEGRTRAPLSRSLAP